MGKGEGKGGCACCIGGVMDAHGGWRTGLLHFLCWCQCAWMLAPFGPGNYVGWIKGEDKDTKMWSMCSTQICMFFVGDPATHDDDDDEHAIGTYTWMTTQKAFGSCDDLKSHLVAMNVFGGVSALFVFITWIMHVSNTMCGCCACVKRHLWICHAVQAGLIMIYWCLMAGAFDGEFCGTSIKDMKVGDSNFQLGSMQFGAAICAWIATILMTLLCCPHGPLAKRGYAYKHTPEGPLGTSVVVAQVAHVAQYVSPSAECTAPECPQARDT